MRHLLVILAALLLCAAPAQAQTLKAVMYNTNNGFVVQPSNSQFVLFSTNLASLWSATNAAEARNAIGAGTSGGGTNSVDLASTNATGILPLSKGGTGATNAAGARTNLGLGATWLTNTNATSFRNNIFAANATNVGGVADRAIALWDNANEEIALEMTDGNVTIGVNSLESFQSALGIGAANVVTISGLTNNGNIRINQTTPTNGLLFVYRTNNEAFLGIANLIASNNTTVGNESLFRVGRAEATNQSAQFGFRVVRTNNGGEGFAVFSVFGFNALMMIGPSDRSRTNTATNAAIEADIYTISGSNRVMTLRDTNSGALTLHQELGFSTGGITTNAPANTTNVALWLRVWVGTNNYRLPLYQ